MPWCESHELTHRLPVFAQDVEAHVSLQVDVGVVDFGLAQHLHLGGGRRERYEAIRNSSWMPKKA